jgi:hypothetical protein
MVWSSDSILVSHFCQFVRSKSFKVIKLMYSTVLYCGTGWFPEFQEEALQA